MKILAFIPIFLLAACGSSGGGSPAAPSSPNPPEIMMEIVAPPTVYYTGAPDQSYRVKITLTNIGGSNSSAGGIEVWEDGSQMPSVFAPTLAPFEQIDLYYQLWNAQGIAVIKTYTFKFYGKQKTAQVQFAAMIGG